LLARVASASADISDAGATARLLAGVPHGDELRDRLAEPLLFQHWDEPSQSAFWIASNGAEIRCVTVTGLTMKEMGEIWINVNDRLSRAHFAISPQLVREVIEAEIDVGVELVN
jgi:hypothetical protein